MTIAILSWRSPKTLENTLNSYRSLGLDKLDDDKVIFFQDISNDDEIIAYKYGYYPMGAFSNIGIAEAYKSLLEYAGGDTFLFLENDWELIQDPVLQITEARTLLRHGKADVVRLRSRAKPGWPLWSSQFAGHEMQSPSHLLDAVHWRENPEHLGPIEKDGMWYKTTAQFANWTNNPTMFRTQWLKDKIAKRMTNDIEQDLQPWWEQQDFIVAQGEGLFTHNRIDR